MARIHLCTIFYNVGGYHAARLDAAKRLCESRDWQFTAIEIARSTDEHPWGQAGKRDYLHTLIESDTGQHPALPMGSLLSSKLDELSPDVVAIPGWGFNFARLALQWSIRRRRRAVLMSESKLDDAPRSMWKEAAKRILLRRFSSAVVGGGKHSAYLRCLGMPDHKIYLGYDVVDNDYFIDRVDNLRRTSARCDLPAGIQDRPYFLAANRFISRKNLGTLIVAFARFAAARKWRDDWDLVLLGNGPEHEALTRLARETGLAKRIHFPGFATYDEICHWYAFASIFVHPARSEQWGLVVNEAMASALPTLVSSACGCYPDLLIEDETGCSFDPGSAETLSTLMERLAADENLRARMGHAARMHVQQNYQPSHFGNALVAAADLGLTT